MRTFYDEALMVKIPAQVTRVLTGKGLAQSPSKSIPKEHMEACADKVKAAIEKQLGTIAERKAGASFYYAVAAQRFLMLNGHDILMQAGAMKWPVCAANEQSTYKFPHYRINVERDMKAAHEALAVNALPEMHFWNCHPGSNMIIDFSSPEYVEHSMLINPEFKWNDAMKPKGKYVAIASSLNPPSGSSEYKGEAKQTAMFAMICINMYATGNLDWLVEASKEWKL